MSENLPPEPEELVQAIIVLVDRIEPAAEPLGIAAVAVASVRAYLADPDNPLWRPWARGAFAKSVRRADAKMFAKVVALFPEQPVVAVGAARAIGLPPLPAQGLPKLIAKLQVSGTHLPPTDDGADDGAPLGIVLNAALGMSTGKAAAQAAHALFAWVVQAPPARVAAWVADDYRVEVLTLPAREFRKGARKAVGPVIADAGRTEIAPGSTTAYVRLLPGR